MNRQLTTQKLELLFRRRQRLLLGSLAHPGGLARRATSCSTSSFSVGMLLAFIAYKDQFLGRVEQPDRPGCRAEDAAAARRAAGRHRADAAGAALGAAATPTTRPGRWRSRCATCASATATPSRGCSTASTSGIEPGESVAIVGAVGLRQDDAAEDARRACCSRTEANCWSTASRWRIWAPTRWRVDDRRRDAGRPAVRRLDRRQHLLLRRPARLAPHRGVRAVWPRCTTRSPRCRWATTR